MEVEFGNQYFIAFCFADFEIIYFNVFWKHSSFCDLDLVVGSTTLIATFSGPNKILSDSQSLMWFIVLFYMNVKLNQLQIYRDMDI